MSKVVKVYKVTTIWDQSILTLYKSRRFENEFSLTYEKNEVTTPRFGKIFAFDDFIFARDFARQLGDNYKISLCEAEKSKEQRDLQVDLGETSSIKAVLKYWLDYPKVAYGRLRRYLINIPAHTVFCDWIKPLDVVEEYYPAQVVESIHWALRDRFWGKENVGYGNNTIKLSSMYNMDIKESDAKIPWEIIYSQIGEGYVAILRGYEQICSFGKTQEEAKMNLINLLRFTFGYKA